MINLYSPPQSTLWTGRPDADRQEYVYQVIQMLNLYDKHLSSLPQSFALLGFCSDIGIKRNYGRTGAQLGPNAFREAFAKTPVHHSLSIFDSGNVVPKDQNLEEAQHFLANFVQKLLSLNCFPIVIGGGHETAYGHFLGLQEFYHDEPIAILNFDAHFDLRESTQSSSGTPFRQIHQYLKQKNLPFNYYCAGIQPFSNCRSLLDYASNNHVQYLLAEQIHHHPHDLSFIENIIQQHQRIYVSLCLDVFHCSIAPGVSAPQALGIHFNYVLDALKLLKASQKVIALDIVELSPPHDFQSQTAKLASALLSHFLQ
jgi:formiminoglutamase